jgi:hypothetical protein
MKPIAMKRVCLFILAASSYSFAQQGPRVRIAQGAGGGPGPVTIGFGAFGGDSGAPVQGAPYSATITNESVQTLADGNRIVHNSSGTIARDSLGRTRRDMSLPAIGNLSVANAPHLVFIQDPVAQTSYTLNLNDKTAHKMPLPPGGMARGSGAGVGPDAFFVQVADGPGPLPLPPPAAGVIVQKGNANAAGELDQVVVADGQVSGFSEQGQVAVAGGEAKVTRAQGQVSTEDLGSQTMQGVYVTGVRTTRTIPAGQIGNDKPISIVTEVWTSPDLKTIVYSKRSDPRMGEQIFQLTNITRNEPDASLFTVPPDFKFMEGPKTVIYRSNQ